MTLVQDLGRHGLAFQGDPPSTTLEISGGKISVSITEADGRVELRTWTPLQAAPDPLTVANITRQSPGDTRLTGQGSTLVVTRTLIEPTLSAVYDALYDLAKTATSVSALQAELAALREELAPAPASSEAFSTPATTQATASPGPTATTSGPLYDQPIQQQSPYIVAPQPPTVEAGPFWFTVETEQPLMSGGRDNYVVATLRPGSMYLALGQQGEWIRARDDHGNEGWVSAAAVRRR